MPTATMTPRPKLMSDGPSAADLQFGYEFGCEGLVSLTFACEFLGAINRVTLNRLVASGKLRKGNLLGVRQSRAGICKRSLREYVRSTES